MVKCQCLTKIMIDTHGDTAFLEIDVARKLERHGQVRILELPRSNLGASSSTNYLYCEKFGFAGAVKIAWVQDYDKDGGAELSNYQVVKVGQYLGFDIVGVTPKNLNTLAMEKADIIVLNNFFNFGEEYYQRILKICYDGGKPYVKYEHDHREITERKTQAERLFSSSALNVFISPLQMRNHVAALGEKLSKNSITLPLAIDTDKFGITNNVREPNSVLVPVFKKCVNKTLDYIVKHPEYKYTVMGHIDIPASKNVVGIPQTISENMCGLYNTFETVLHLPEKIGGGERVIFEAVLCGCKVITNENSAHTTWDEQFDWKNHEVLRMKLSSAPYEFWRAVCRLKK